MIKELKRLKNIIPFITIGIFFWVLNERLAIEINVFIVSYQAYLKAMVYILCFLIAIIGITVNILSKNTILAWLAIFVFSLFTFIESGYLDLNLAGLGYEDVLLISQNIGFGLNGQAILTFKSSLVVALVSTLVFITLSTILRYNFEQRYSSYYGIVYILSLFFVWAIINNSQANRVAFPAPSKIPPLIAYTLSKKLYVGPKDVVKSKISAKSEIDHIIWVVDESVRADHLGINGYHRNTTPFLNSIRDRIINFGISSSASVCSDYSHFVLMAGLTEKEILESSKEMRKKPLIFQYAKKAKFSPALVYSPGYEDKPKGYLTSYDFEHIPIRYQTAMLHPELQRYEHDIKSIDYLLQHINKESKTFTYFLKYGSHFHYEDAYPDSLKSFLPTQDPRDWKFENKEQVINSYDNSIIWAVDTFFERLISKLNGQRYLIIYTSDHGQNILDYPEISLTHCLKNNAPSVMAQVPMMILGDSISISTFTEKYSFISKASHFHIFPATLELMGYDDKVIIEDYSGNLLDSTHSNRIYFSGDIFGRSQCIANSFD